jgi:hypothetical protein
VKVREELEAATWLSTNGVDCWVYLETYVEDV